MIVRRDPSRFTDFLILREDQGPDALMAAGTKIEDIANSEIHPACGSLRLSVCISTFPRKMKSTTVQLIG